ncbi:uncharacterized protein [Panulirus ornatus]|uniref:uncharacterized protein n=1 Tax=Panulirus ornatus TaxID=150431 RepID=UPI003A8C7A7C
MRSELLHTPPADHHYTRLRCWAANQVDEQRNPCEFFVVPAPKPVAVSECSVGEPDTSEAPLVAAQVSCVAGEDGGLSQTFTLHVQDPDNETTSQHNNQPVFTVERLRMGVPYLLTVTVASALGASPPYTFSVIFNDTTEATSSSAVNNTTEASSSAVNDTTEASSSAGQVAPPDASNWFLLVLFMVVAWTAVQACPCFLLGGVLIWMYLRRRPPRNHPHPHALTNGDPTREVLLKPPTSNGSYQPFVRSSTPVDHIDVYLERERNRFRLMGNAPRASLDSLELSTAPPSVYSDPLRSLQPSPFIVDPGPETLVVGGGGETRNSGRETSRPAGSEGVSLLAAEGGGDATRGVVGTTEFEGGAAAATVPPRVVPLLETSLDDDM